MRVVTVISFARTNVPFMQGKISRVCDFQSFKSKNPKRLPAQSKSTKFPVILNFGNLEYVENMKIFVRKIKT